jgi:hypothetical protein
VAPIDASRHGRAADALISSYLRELLADDELEPPSGQPTMPLPAALQASATGTERGLSAET